VLPLLTLTVPPPEISTVAPLPLTTVERPAIKEQNV
jgi:hypothetical protein